MWGMNSLLSWSNKQNSVNLCIYVILNCKLFDIFKHENEPILNLDNDCVQLDTGLRRVNKWLSLSRLPRVHIVSCKCSRLELGTKSH